MISKQYFFFTGCSGWRDVDGMGQAATGSIPSTCLLTLVFSLT
jgi:hypothetical protein